MDLAVRENALPFIVKELKVQIEEKACAVMTWENWDINITGKILNNKPVQGVL
ncbi:MAG: hypothetical protein VB018_12375 [Lachnospiraceae bacterium]|nr:hypothetical protein [Lachnospiraceae bacterium]